VDEVLAYRKTKGAETQLAREAELYTARIEKRKELSALKGFLPLKVDRIPDLLAAAKQQELVRLLSMREKEYQAFLDPNRLTSFGQQGQIASSAGVETLPSSSSSKTDQEEQKSRRGKRRRLILPPKGGRKKTVSIKGNSRK